MQMKLKTILAIILGTLALASCNTGAGGSTNEDNSAKIALLQQKVAQINTDLQALHVLCYAAQNNLYIKDIAETSEGTVTLLSNGETFTVAHDSNANGPFFGAMENYSSEYIWTVTDGTKIWLKDVSGQMRTAGLKSSVVPTISISDEGYWCVGYEGGLAFVKNAEGRAISALSWKGNGYAVFKDVNYDESSACYTLKDGTTIVLPVGESGVTPDDPQDPDDPDEPDTPTPSTGNQPGYYELPVMNISSSGSYKVNANNSNEYYATHSFKMNSKTYRNYTVCYSGEHHCAVWVAAPRHSVYSNEGTKRSNAYQKDPNIPSSIQYSSKSTGGGCNKGHMLGSAERLCCSDANVQVFYYTNIAPQLSSGFNTGGGGWNTLEDWVDTKQCADTLYEVVGCYFEKFTDGYGYTVSPKTITFGGRSDVDMPTMFYYVLLRTKKGSTGKSVAKCSADELMCAAFVRSHTNSLKGQSVSSKEMMSVSDLEKITGVTYFPNVPNAPKSSFKASDWGL